MLSGVFARHSLTYIPTLNTSRKMNLSTSYIGLDLPNPLVVGASPLGGDIDTLCQCAEAGAAAVVMHSLFEEQIKQADPFIAESADLGAAPSAEASDYLPHGEIFSHGADDYIEKIRQAKRAVDIPIIGSLNGTHQGPWLDYAGHIADAGADALELTVYRVPTDPAEEGAAAEKETLEMVAAVKELVDIPVAVKLSPFYSSLPNFVERLDALGVDGLVVFNRFFHPDVDVEVLEVERRLVLSRPSDLFLRLRWLAILSACGHSYDLAITGGVHSGADAIKSIMCGADAVQLVSTLLMHGPQRLTEIRDEMERWMEAHEYESIQQMKGSMDLKHCPDAMAYERANYVRILQHWDTCGHHSPTA